MSSRTVFCNIFPQILGLTVIYLNLFCLLLILKSTEESFIADFRHWVIPFLERLGKRKKKSQVNLIHQYLTDVAKVVWAHMKC